jgi:hypothetical protein
VRWQTFIAMTLAYVTFYVCRLSFTVAKSALVESSNAAPAFGGDARKKAIIPDIGGSPQVGGLTD